MQAHIVDKASRVLVTDGSGNPMTMTIHLYDEAGHIGSTPTGVSTHDDVNYGAGSILPRGDLTTETHCVTISGTGANAVCATAEATMYYYDLTGQLTQRVESPGTSVAESIAYTWGGMENGLLQSVTYPNGASDAYTYWPTGVVKTHTDWNGQATTYAYTYPTTGTVDPLGRIRTIALPATVDGTTGSAGSGVATYTYTDTPGAVAVREQHTLSRSGTNTSVTKVFDGLGRVVNVSKAVPISECGMGAVQVNTSYDTMGRVYTVTNPYCATSDSTYGSSQYNYDYFGRKILQTQPDASSLQWCYDGSQNPSGGASCSSNRSSITPATWVDSFDETGRHWQHVSDGLGRLAAAIKPNPSNGSLALETDYTYDALSNLLSVTQKGLSTDTPRVRNFTYDAMSHLLCASNPENSSSIFCDCDHAEWRRKLYL